jgi:hypothetical protein
MDLGDKKLISILEVFIMLAIAVGFMIGAGVVAQNKHESKPEASYKCVDSSCYKKELDTSKEFDEKSIVAINKKPVEIVEPKPESVVVKEDVIENHYHFQELNTGLMAFAGLGGAALIFFILYKIIGFGRTSFVLAKAKKKSNQLLAEFDNVVDDVKRSIEYNKKIVEQVAFNNLLLQINKNNPSVSPLIVSNQMMKDKLIFIERKILNDFKN